MKWFHRKPYLLCSLALFNETYVVQMKTQKPEYDQTGKYLDGKVNGNLHQIHFNRKNLFCLIL